MRKPVVVLAALLVLTGIAGAAVDIERPSDGATITDDPFVPLDVKVSGESGDVTYSLNGGPEHDCDCTGTAIPLEAEQGENTVRVFLDGEERDRVSFHVDSEAPEIQFTRPGSGMLLDPEPELRIYYNDTTGIDTDHVEVTLDGEPVDGNVTDDRFVADLAGIGEGTFTIDYRIPDIYWNRSGGEHVAEGAWNFTLPLEPVVADRRPTGTVGGSPVVAVTLQDPAGIDPEATSLTVVRDGETVTSVDVPGGTTVTKDIGTAIDGLTDGTYTVRLRAVDGRGIDSRENWTFTVDTSPPDVDIVSPGNGTVAVGEETVSVEAVDALSDVRRVNVTAAGESVVATRDGDRFTATIDTTGVPDGVQTVRASAVDTAGNTATATTRIRVDNGAPTVTNVTIYPDPVVGGVLATARITDAATDIVGARWTIGRQGSTDVLAEGRLDAVGGPYDSREEAVRVAERVDLAEGTYVLSVRAKDGAGHWSNGHGQLFTVDTGEQPALDVAVPDTFPVVRGETGTVRMHVANTGAADEHVTVSVDSDIDVSVEPGREKVQAGENRTFTVSVDAPGEREMLGAHNVTLDIDGLTDAERVTRQAVVQPVPERQDEIMERYGKMRERFAALNESRRSMDIEGTNMSDRFDEAAAAITTISRLLDDGRYHAAAERMDASQDVLAEAENTFTAAATRARIDTAKSVGLRLLLVALFLGLLVGAYRLIPAPDGFDPEEGFAHRPDGKHPVRMQVEAAVQRVRDRLGEEDETDTRPGPWSGF